MIKIRLSTLALLLCTQISFGAITANAEESNTSAANIGISEISEILCSNIQDKTVCLNTVQPEVEKYFSTMVQITGVVSSIKNQINAIPNWKTVPILPSEPIINWEELRGTGIEGINLAKSKLVQYVQNILVTGDQITLKLNAELKNKYITCVKGKSIKKTKSISCPKGYKKK